MTPIAVVRESSGIYYDLLDSLEERGKRKES
jgi:hypothetical protein